MAGEMGPAAFMWPPDRTWSAATDNTAPCGSVGNVGNRTEFPLTGGRIALVGQDDSYSVQLGLSTATDPQNNNDFQILIQPERIPSMDEGHTCIPVPNPPSGTAAGTNATLQLVYIADFDEPTNQTFYACADITYVAALDFTTTIPCFNATEDSGATFNHTEPTSTAEASAIVSRNRGGGGLSGGAIAGIVIGVVVGVALLGIGAFFLYREKKKNNRLMRQRDSLRQVKAADIDAAGKDSTSQNSIQLKNMNP